MGWIKEHKNDNNVQGIIITGAFDRKLKYALSMIQNVEIFIYKVDFSLEEFSE